MEVKVNVQGLSLSSHIHPNKIFSFFYLNSPDKCGPRIHGVDVHFDTERMSCSLIKTHDNNVHSKVVQAHYYVRPLIVIIISKADLNVVGKNVSSNVSGN